MALAYYQRCRQFDLVVFHPSYEYEQFVGGIAPALAADGQSSPNYERGQPLEKEGDTPSPGSSRKDSAHAEQENTLEPDQVLGKGGFGPEPSGSSRGLRYEVKPGIFLELCRHAPKVPSVVLIIDEINRGNLPKLLGELVYALEYRDSPVRLPFEYRGEKYLRVPKNLYVIATMNSSDRSIGHIDAAVRRRFALMPVGPDSKVVEDNWKGAGDHERGKKLGKLMDDLNKDLASGELGDEIGVGHSYFLCDPTLKEPDEQIDPCRQVRRKWEYQVLPLLKEYQHLTSLQEDSIKEYTKELNGYLGYKHNPLSEG